MSKLLRIYGRLLGLLAITAWVWKGFEVVGRERGTLPRNLGWGYVVDLTAPVLLTILALAVLLFAAVMGDGKSP